MSVSSAAMRHGLVLALVVTLAGCHGGDHKRLVFGFDRAVPDEVLEQAKSLVAARFAGASDVRVERRGDQIVVDVSSSNEIARDMESLDIGALVLPRPPRLELRVDDGASPYMEKLVAHVRVDDVARDTLKLEPVVDYGMRDAQPTDNYIKAVSTGKYVNVAWADKHGCDSKQRTEGLGVYCLIDAAELLDAYFHGDKQLFVEPLDPEFAVPADHEIVYDKRNYKESRTHYLEREPLIFGVADLASASHTRDATRIELTARGAALLSRARDKRLLTADDYRPVTIEPTAITLTGADGLLYDLAFAHMPAKLVRRQ